jgi:hypothetical protein
MVEMAAREYFDEERAKRIKGLTDLMYDVLKGEPATDSVTAALNIMLTCLMALIENAKGADLEAIRAWTREEGHNLMVIADAPSHEVRKIVHAICERKVS